MNILPKHEFTAKQALEAIRQAQSVAENILKWFAKEQEAKPLQTKWRYFREIDVLVAQEVEKILEKTLAPLGWTTEWYKDQPYIVFEIF